MLLWSARFGKAEVFMDALNYKHFQEGKSASERNNVLAAAKEAGLNEEAAKQFLDTPELESTVWRSYGDTIRKHAIHAIPYFVFSVPALQLVGGPFRDGPGTPWIVNGSMDAERFLEIFTEVYNRWRRTGHEMGKCV